MILDPVLPVAMLVIFTVVLGGFAIWRIVASTRPSLRLAWAIRLVMVLLLLVVALRPVIPGGQTGPRASGQLEVWFAVDTTSSMAAQDFGPPVVDPTDGAQVEASTRLAGAKADMMAIAGRLSGASFSLVSFDSTAIQRVPLTSDASALDSAASVLTQEVTSYSKGSSIDEPVGLLTTLLKADSEKNPRNQRVLFYLGDGEQTAAAEPGSFAALAPFISGGRVLGYGTAEGGRMLTFDGYADQYSSPEYIRDYSQSPPVDAVSKTDATALTTIAAQLDIGYSPRTDGAPVDDLVTGLDVGSLSIEPGTPGGATELYWIFAIPLGLLTVLELIRLSSVIAESRRVKGRAS